MGISPASGGLAQASFQQGLACCLHPTACGGSWPEAGDDLGPWPVFRRWNSVTSAVDWLALFPSPSGIL